MCKYIYTCIIHTCEYSKEHLGREALVWYYQARNKS